MFHVKLKRIHERIGITAYRAGKDAGISINTVERYTKDDVVCVTKLEPALVKLCQYYGVDWRDPNIIEYMPDPDQSDTQPVVVRPELAQPVGD